jgi:hypothetical protein
VLKKKKKRKEKEKNRRRRRPASPQAHLSPFLLALHWITPQIIEFTWEAWLVCPTDYMSPFVAALH